MEGHLFSFPKRFAASSREALRRMEGYFFVYYIDHFSDVPTGDAWQSAYGYAKEVSKILLALARRLHANVLLVGQEGVGSLGIAKEVAHQIAMHPELKGSRIIFVNMEELLSSIPSGIEQLHAITNIVSEAERLPNVVIIVSGMKNVFAGKYALSAEDILHPFFSSLVRTITILSDEEYHAHIAQNKELAHFVEPVQIPGLSIERTKKFLRKLFASTVDGDVLDEVVEKTENILSHIPYPKRAIDIIQELIANKTVSKEHVQHAISKKGGFDIRRIQDAHSLNLKEVISRHVVHQTQAIQEIADAMTRARSKPAHIKHPIASILFEGPQGVGKKETAKAIAQTYFGSRERLVFLDMETFSEDLPAIITEHPFCVLVLTGLEKASQKAQDSLRFVLNNGYIADRFGRAYFATHMIIIGLCRDRSFCSESLLQSFDGIAPFVSLASEHVQEIARRMLAKFNGRLQMEHNVSLEITPELVSYLAEEGYTEEFGAHAMKEVMQNTVEHAAMQAIARGKVVPGGKIVIDPK